ncbi:hypothetical protein [Poriferisphaera sp. WC338]|uniref:hypothetical protein n=1 Tax=Poriferisphaera sp. WC338 TaxID=3425129 RepID=UPI003D81779C
MKQKTTQRANWQMSIATALMLVFGMLIGTSEAYALDQPKVEFDPAVSSQYDRASNGTVRFKFDGYVPNGLTIHYWAWSRGLGKTVPNWSGTLSNGVWAIPADQMRKLPDGDNKILIAVKLFNTDTQYYSKWYRVLGQTNSNNGNEQNPPTTPAFAPIPDVKIADGQKQVVVKGEDNAVKLSMSGQLPSDFSINYWGWSQSLGKTVPNWSGEINGSPWEISSSSLAKLPIGDVKLIVSAKAPKQQTRYFSQWITVKENSGSNGNDSGSNGSNDNGSSGNGSGSTGSGPLTVGFHSSTTTPYALGDGRGMKIDVNGQLPNGMSIHYWGWSRTLNKAVPNWSGDVKNSPWEIPASQLAKLPRGDVKIALAVKVLGQNTKYYQQWIKLTEATSGGNGNSGNDNGNTGGDTGQGDSGGAGSGATAFPVVSFGSSTTQPFYEGDQRPADFNVSGELPNGFFLYYFGWSRTLGDKVPNWGGKIEGSPWEIPASELSKLPRGDVKIVLSMHASGIDTVYQSQWITMKDADPGSTGGSGSGSGGSGSGNGNTGGSGGDNGNGNGSTGGGGSGSGNGNGSGNTGGGGSGSGNGGGNTGDDSGNWDENGMPERHPFLGINTASVTYWSDSWIFADLFKQTSYRQSSQGWDEHFAFWDSDGKYPKPPAGKDYIVEYEGSGEVQVIQRSGIKILTKGDVRNLKVYADESHRGLTFHPTFTERLKPFSVIRYMDWQLTNNSKQQTWSDRTQPDAEHQADGPIALEYIVQLSNETQSSPWVCTPHEADDNYVRKMAEMFRDNLDPNLKIYVEYSNEVWNGVFQQHHWINDKGNANPAWPDHKLLRQWAYEAGRDFDIWSDVFAGQEHRIIRVVAGQEGNPWVTKMVASFIDGRFDAISSTAYFPAHIQGGESANAVMQEAISQIEGRKERRVTHGDLAKEYTQTLGRPITYVAYEAGQHVTLNGGSLDTLKEVNRSDAMYQATLENMQSFEAAGGSLYVGYQYVRRPSNSGAWGYLEYQDQPVAEAPKWRALVEYLKSDTRLELTMFD